MSKKKQRNDVMVWKQRGWARPWTAACRLCVRDTYHATHTEAITSATRHATLHGGRRG